LPTARCHDAAAKGDQDAGAVGAVLHHLVGEPLDVGEALILLAAGKKERLEFPAIEGRLQFLPVQKPDVARRHNNDAAMSRG
jgi:hypothetical protein